MSLVDMVLTEKKKPDNIQLNDYDQGNHSCFLSMLHNNSHVQIAH